MSSVKKSWIYMLIIALSFLIMTSPSFATVANQDGLEVTLTTDKEVYEKQENIEVTLTVRNTNDFDISDVSLESIIPEGYKLDKESKAIKQIDTLKAGETVSMAVKYIATESKNDENNNDEVIDKDDIVKPIGPENDENNTNEDSDKGDIGKPTEPENDENNTNEVIDKENVDKPNKDDNKNPSTGESSNTVLWLVLLGSATIGIVIITIRNKKSIKRLLSLVLSIAMVGTVFTSFATIVDAAEENNLELSLCERVDVADKSLDIKATVKYSIKKDLTTGVGEISFREPAEKHIVLDEETGTYYIDNEILIVAHENTTKHDVEKIIKEFDGKIVGFIEITNDYQVEVSRPMLASELNEIVEKLNENDAIEMAMLHNLYEAETSVVPNDEKWNKEEWSAEFPEGKNWGVEAINAMGAWDEYNKMSYVKVGIIDSMFDVNHEDLVYTKVWNNPTSISSEDVDYSDKNHGTHVTGTLAAGYNNGIGITGVAPKVELYGYSMLGTATDSISKNILLDVMEWKYSLALLITSNCRVINVSMQLKKPNLTTSIYQGELLGNYLSKLLKKGYDFVIVQAAGNKKTDALKNGIFCAITQKDVFDRVIVVGAMGNRGSYKNTSFDCFGERVHAGYYYPEFSNYGERVDVVAPGVKIHSTVMNNKYEDSHLLSPWNGTSMAAPHVAGIAAMCFSVNPKLTGKQIKEIIVNCAERKITDHNEKDDGTRPAKSYGIVDANKSVKAALDEDGEGISPVNPSKGIVLGTVVNNDRLFPYLKDVSVSAYRITNSEGNLSEYAASTLTDLEGEYTLILEPGEYYINLYKEGYLPFAIYNVEVNNNQTTYLNTILLISDQYAEGVSEIKGNISNALSGYGVEGVTVRLRPGWNNKDGMIAKNLEDGGDAETVTDRDGKYSIKMKPGCYTAELIKDGFVTGYVNVIGNDTHGESQDAVITPTLANDEYRVVLTWSSMPDDLDSHISGPLSTGDRFHVYYSYMSESDNGETVASLDLDDRTSYGPETITLKKTKDGTYKYAVHDFSNRHNKSSTALSMSGAKVELYRGNSLIAVYHVPVNLQGTVWNVFEISGEEVHAINTLENNWDPTTVC